MAEELKPNAFIGCAAPPADDELTTALGPCRSLWDRILADLGSEFHLSEVEWNSYSPKAGWSVRIKQKKRNILYLIPCKGSFRVAFILGGKAVQASREEKTPARVKKLIDTGIQYPEGLGIRFDVTSDRDLAAVRTLTALKMAH